MARMEVLAEVTGKVWKIEAPVGAKVAEDDAIVIVESMKMEIPVVTTIAGTVVELLVEEGTPVQEGQVVGYVEG